MTDRPTYFPALDALRTFACFCVLLGHLWLEPVFLRFEMGEGAWINFLRGIAGFGVQVFFVLSGFLITYLLLQEQDRNGHISLKNFYIRRCLRIWPLYFGVVTFAFAVYFLTDRAIYESLPLTYLFLSNFDQISLLTDSARHSNAIIAVTWSLSVEEQFYLVWPLLLMFLWRQPMFYLVTIVLSVLFIVYAGEDKVRIYHHTLSNFIFLAAGGFLAYLLFTGARLLEWLRHLPLLPGLAALAVLFVAVVYLRFWQFGGFMLSYVTTTVFLFFMLGLLLHRGVPRGLGWLADLARYTYALYMLHRIAQLIVNTTLQSLPDISSTFAVDMFAAFATTVLVFVLAWLSWRFLERPLLAMRPH